MSKKDYSDVFKTCISCVMAQDTNDIIRIIMEIMPL